MTAWSANVVTSSICLSVNGRTVDCDHAQARRLDRPSRSMRHAEHRAASHLMATRRAQLVVRIGLNIGVSGQSFSRAVPGLPSCLGRAQWMCSKIPCSADSLCSSSDPIACRRGDGRRPEAAQMFCHLCTAQARCGSRPRCRSTVCRSKVERLMTLSTSAVAVCCCRDSRNSLSSRVFSMAMTACAAKFFTNSICLSVNGAPPGGTWQLNRRVHHP